MSKDEFLKMFKEVTEDAEIHIVHVGTEPVKVETAKAEEPVDIYAETKKEAEEIAQLNKILYDAHIAVGFDECDALELTVALIKNND